MLFTSLEFLFIFFPITLAVYFILNKKAKNYWLLFISLFFYAWGEPMFVFVMIGSIICNYIFALGISHFDKQKSIKKLILCLSVVANLGVLFVYKYMNFVTGTLHDIIPLTKELFDKTSFVLPIGISFFTFQAMSYVIDVYRGVPIQKNPFHLGLYISFFPQLIAGPIVRYTTIADQINDRKVTFEGFSKGVLRFLYGFNKKMLLANILSQVADKAFETAELSVSMAWLGIICYTLQIFFDFSGYSEMAIGLGQMFGFRFLENFNYPYISKTITEFWRRWHMSLGSWFRDYLYFPLGGSRVNSKARLVFNLFVVWFATGVWHGASWNFILWGVLYGVIITVEKLMSLPRKLEKKSFNAVIYQIFTLLMVMLGWVLFRATTLEGAVTYIKSMFGFAGNALIDDTSIFYLKDYAVIMLAGLVCSTPIIRNVKNKISELSHKAEMSVNLVSYIVQFVLFIVGVSYLVMNAHNPFIYFNF